MSWSLVVPFVLRFPDGDRDVDVDLADPEATVADLACALSPDAAVHAVTLRCGGVDLPPARRLDRAGIADGAIVEVVLTTAAGTCLVGQPEAGARVRNRNGCAEPQQPGLAAVHLAVVGGLHAGTRIPVTQGRWVVGRNGDLRLLDPTVSGRHAELRVDSDGAATISDLGSTNGTWRQGEALITPTTVTAEDLVAVGAAHLAVRLTGDDEHRRHIGPQPGRDRSGTVPFNRPPRAMPAVDTDPIETPEPPGPSTSALPFSIASLLVPLLIAAVVVKVFHNLMWGAFGLLGPIMFLGTWWEQRHRGRRSRRRADQRWRRDLARFDADLTDAAAIERRRRLAALTDPAEVVGRARNASARLWERRPQHPDWLVLRAGLGTGSWSPPLTSDRRGLPDDAREVLERRSLLTETPVAVDLSGDGVIGIVGPRTAALAVARNLVLQAAVLHGPADLPIAVLSDAAGGRDWDWIKWLPHAIDPTTGRRRLAADPATADAIVADLVEQRTPTDATDAEKPPPTLLAVVDDAALGARRRAAARTVLRRGAGPFAAIVLADRDDQLPATCTAVLTLRSDDGDAVLHRPPAADDFSDLVADGIDETTATEAARALACFEDPESDSASTSLASTARLLPLLDLPRVGDTAGQPQPPTRCLTPDAIAARWSAGGRDPAPEAPIGVTSDGVLMIDLVRDGPHALVAGTTGAGKSELLRTLVTGLAVSCSPDDLTFVLVDFKGGSAFDLCAALPHVVGMVTDLDDHLVGRVVTGLEAELRRRESLLREVDASDVASYRRAAHATPLPRLVVVIDEFATLATGHPDVLDALVGIAQRGRSLGVHLVLATQRPSGSVSDHIRANTNLRIALRTQDSNDSVDVIGRPDAATISRHQPGRAIARLGPGELVTVQTALATSPTRSGEHAPVVLRPFGFGTPCEPRRADEPVGDSVEIDEHRRQTTELDVLVDAMNKAWRAAGRPAPHRPWPDPLPVRFDLRSLSKLLGREAADADQNSRRMAARFALGDDPAQQRRRPMGWDIDDGNVLLVGIPGSGTTTGLAAIACRLAESYCPDELHVHVVDHGAGDLAALGSLPHTGSYIAADDAERQRRLVDYLRAELAQRRSIASSQSFRPGASAGFAAPDTPTAGRPRIVVLLDGIGSFLAMWNDPLDGVADSVAHLLAHGPEVGIHVAVAADRPGAMPLSWTSTIRQRIVFRLAEPSDYGAMGFRPADVPPLGPGRAIWVDSGIVAQVGLPSPDLAAAVARIRTKCPNPRPGNTPMAIGSLPTQLDPRGIVAATRLRRDNWVVPLGIGDHGLSPAGFTLHPGEHALVAGPSRSGRSTTLSTVGRVVAEARAAVARADAPAVVALPGPRSPLTTVAGIDAVLPTPPPPDDIDRLARLGRPLLLLVDDAERFADPDGALAELLAAQHPHVHLVVAGRADALRSLYQHWTRSVRLSRTGLLLDANVDLDGDLLGVTLPRRSPVARAPGRGWLVDGGGGLQVVQVACDSSRLDMKDHQT